MSDQHPGRTSPNLTLAILLVSGAAYATLSSVVIPALSAIQKDLHTTENSVAWLLTGYLLATSVATSIIGRLGDMYGKERMLLCTLVLLGAGALLSAVSHSIGLVIVGRVIQGTGGGVFPLSYGIVRDEFPREKVAGSIGMISAVLGVGGGAGIALSGLILEHFGWQWLFWFPLILIVLAAICAWRFIPESPVRMPGHVNWLAATLMTLGMSAALLAISETTSWGWLSARTLGLFAIGIVICIGWVLAETRSAEPLIDMTMMRIRGVWTTNLVAFMLGGGMYAAFLIYPELAQLGKPVGFGASSLLAGLYLLPMAVTMAIFGAVTGRISASIGAKGALIAGCASTMISFLVMIFGRVDPLEMLISSSLIGVGIGLAYAALGNLIIGAVRPEQTGVATGMNTVTRTLGGALGGQISASLVAGNIIHGSPGAGGFHQSFVMCLAFLVVSLAASTLVPSQGRTPTKPLAAEERSLLTQNALG